MMDDSQMSLLDALPPVARATDPETSQIAARLIRSKRPSQMLQLLHCYASQGPLTDEQAGTVAGLAHTGYWKRCADLRAAGLTQPTGITMTGTAGVPQQLCRITPEGERVVLARAKAGE